jgi:hypothetical protein
MPAFLKTDAGRMPVRSRGGGRSTDVQAVSMREDADFRIQQRERRMSAAGEQLGHLSAGARADERAARPYLGFAG